MSGVRRSAGLLGTQRRRECQLRSLGNEQGRRRRRRGEIVERERRPEYRREAMLALQAMFAGRLLARELDAFAARLVLRAHGNGGGHAVFAGHAHEAGRHEGARCQRGQDDRHDPIAESQGAQTLHGTNASPSTEMFPRDFDEALPGEAMLDDGGRVVVFSDTSRG